ncbi:uncharacterized protein LOC101945282 [Chrysemys picta bellii]|uniref:uncharacterized protein LOC101945282 n=1 Tax=Chrysemys picta bellii TaxID=8478 RepID=UPI0032B2DC16
MEPGPPVPHAPLLPHGTAIEFCPLETPFVAPEGRELLERHVLRKRLQHEWGLPGLVRRSLRCFMPPPPTRPRPKGRVRLAAMELRVSSGAPPIPLATKRDLEAHIWRRVAERRWGLPRRVRESLRGFMPPTTAAPGTHPDTRGRRASRPLRGLSARRAPRESPSRGAPVGPAAVAVSLAGPLGTAWSQQLSRDTCHQLLERHVTRKNIEIRLGLIPRRAQHSQEAARQAGKLPLPRLIRPDQRSLEQRPRELFFLEQATSDHLELNLLHKHLSFRWGLPTLYRQSLAKLFHAGPSSAPPPSSSRAAGTEFTAQELPFLPPGAREELELHVRTKRLQHEWGLPLIVQKSMRGLMAAPPRPGQPKAPPPADGDVAVLQAELSFLSEGSRRELELSLRKRLMQRRWGLPRRIQESVRLLRPTSAPAEFGPCSRTEKDAEGHFLLPWHKSTVHLERGVGKARRVVAAPRPRLSLGRDAQERLQLHVAKKCVETRLGAIPAAVRRSWQRLHLVSRLPLPKLIPAGDRAPKARNPLLPFVHPEDVCHLELNVQHKHLTALWGLGTLYTQSLSRMVPRAPRVLIPPREAEVEFRAREALFLGPEVREVLELHVRKKRLQHEWGLPLILQKSMRGLMAAPPRPGQPKAPPPADGDVAVTQAELSFLSEGSRRELEFSLRKRLMQRRWGLPRRIQESVRLLRPTSVHTELEPHGPAEKDAEGPFLLPWHKSTVHLERGVGKARRVVAAPRPRLSLGRDAQERLQLHVAKKCVETRLGAIPAAVRRSWQRLHLVSRLPLPELIPAGDRALKARNPLLPFVHPEDICHLELNVQHKHLTALWGLGTLYTQSLSRMVPRAPRVPVPPREAEVEFRAREALFLGPEVRGVLELHVRKKRLQHEWGLPLIVQKSMRGLMAAPPHPGQPKAPPPADGDVAVTQAELSFLSEGSRRELELSLRKRLMQRRWGLPRRIQESVRLLRPTSVHTELEPHGPAEKDAEGPFLLPWHKSTVHLERGVGKARRVVAAPRPRLSLGRDAQERLQLHVAKKCVETRLGAIPAAVRRSWQRLHLVSRLPLPKLIPARDRALKARNPLLPFVHPEDICHLELNVQHKHLTALWGLGTIYTQSLSRMVPRAPRAPVPPREAEVEYRAREALFLGPEAREVLELHVRKKRLQHEWGFPALIQRSLRAFMPEPPLPGPTAARQRAELHILVLGQQPSLMDGDTRDRLERHLRKMTLQRRWGLPRRIQESLRLFSAFAPLAGAQLPGAGGERGIGQSRLRPSQSDVPTGSRLAGDSRTHGLAAERRDELQRHLARKCLEIRLGVRPALVEKSQRVATEAVPQHVMGSSSRRSQETSQTSDGEGSPGSPHHFPEDKAELKSTLDFPGKKVLGISDRAQGFQRLAFRPAAHEPHPQQREQSSEESPGQWSTHDGEGAPRLVGTGRRSRSSSVETAVWSEKRISRELESSFRRMVRSRSRHGPGGKQPLSLEIVGHLEMDHCTCLHCPCSKLEGWDGARSLGTSSPVWQTQRIHVRGSATLLGDAADSNPLHAEPGWQGQGAPSVAKDEPPVSSPSSLEGSEFRASDWSAGESARAASRPAPKGPSLAREHLASPWAAAHRLDIHLAQKALGSFILPPCVIHSQAVYADMAAERLRAAAQERRRKMNIRLQRRRSRKSQLGGPRQEALGERARPAGTGEPGFLTAGTNVRQTEALVLTEAPPRAEQPPRAPPGRGAKSSSVPCKGKGPTFRGIILGFLERVTSRASVGERGQVDRSVAAPRGAPPPPRKLTPSPKSVKLSPSLNRGNATEDTSGTVGASNLERRGHRAGVETELPQPGSRPGKSAGHVCWFHQRHAHAHLRQVHGRTPALHGENLCALRERMQVRRRKLSPSLNSLRRGEPPPGLGRELGLVR